LKIGKTLGIGTALVQRVVTEQPRPFEVDVAEAAFVSWIGRSSPTLKSRRKTSAILSSSLIATRSEKRTNIAPPIFD
jgi:hypothetical protein